VRALIEQSTRRLARARLHYGHGTESARDDAAALVLHAMRLPADAGAAALARRVTLAACGRLELLMQRRMRERVPVVYLTQRCWFAGLPFLRSSDFFAALGRARYDIIVSNPPYVGEGELQGLPAEYWHEPRLALAAGRDGLAAVRIILRDAAAHLTEDGALFVEVGDSERALRRAFPRLPFLWLAFQRGGGGVFLLTRAQLVAQAVHTAQGARTLKPRRP